MSSYFIKAERFNTVDDIPVMFPGGDPKFGQTFIAV